MSDLTIDAERENLDKVLEFINTELFKFGCEEDIMTKIDIAVEEIFVNISSYAYEEKGDVEVSCKVYPDNLTVEIELKDSGIPYNPLERENPDVDMPIEKRGIGGLGIFITKRLMDDVRYKFENGKNVLIICKKINKEEEVR